MPKFKVGDVIYRLPDSDGKVPLTSVIDGNITITHVNEKVEAYYFNPRFGKSAGVIPFDCEPKYDLVPKPRSPIQLIKDWLADKRKARAALAERGQE